MPLDKPTISHQLKTVKLGEKKKLRSTSFIHSAAVASNDNYQTRSHLKSQKIRPTKNTFGYTSTEGDKSNAKFTDSELKQCTKLLRNVLASDALVLKHVNNPKKNKSTSTDDYDFQREFTKPDKLNWKKFDRNQIESKSALSDPIPTLIDLDDQTEAESIITEIENPHTNKKHPAINNKLNTPPNCPQSHPICVNCQLNSTNQMPGLIQRDFHDRTDLNTTKFGNNQMSDAAVCCRCHNVIQNSSTDAAQINLGISNLNWANKNSNLPPTPKNNSCEIQNQQKPIECKGSYNFGPNNNIVCPPLIDMTTGSGQPADKIESLANYLQSRLCELQTVVRTTRDADLDRIVSDLDRVFQLMLRENGLICNHLKSIAKTLKWENSTYKQKIKSLNDSNYDLKTELKLYKQDSKQKIEELKLAVKVKSDELSQLTDRDKTNSIYWKEKYHKLEKELEKVRTESQANAMEICHKDTEIVQLKHGQTQLENKYKDEIQSLRSHNQEQQLELNLLRQSTKKYESEILHNQSIIKAAREQVVNLLERHKPSGKSVSHSNNQSVYETSLSNGSGDWIFQATSLQRVLSMAKDIKTISPTNNNEWQNNSSYCNNNNTSSTPVCYSGNVSATHHSVNNPMFTNLTTYNSSNFNNNNNNNDNVNNNNNNNTTTMSHEHTKSSNATLSTNFNENNYNNNYHSTNSNKTGHQSNRQYDHNQSQNPKSYLTINSLSSTSLDSSTSPTLSPRSSINISNISDFPNNNHNSCEDNVTPTPHDQDQFNVPEKLHDPWNYPDKIVNSKKISSISSAMSTVSSLRSTDDADFRCGLQKLDYQIVRLQNTLKSKLPQQISATAN